MSNTPAALLKASSGHLKHWAFLTGLASTGTKAELMGRLQGTASAGRLSPPFNNRQRIVSVDMGIRNLAFCAVDLELRTPPASLSKFPSESRLESGAMYPKVVQWKRMDLTTINVTPAGTADAIEPEEESQSDADKSRTRPVRKSMSKLRNSILNTDFTPPRLSKTAYMVTQELLALRPDIILIERQRFRSGGAAAIQEWTVRVNMLESMLWACLETLREQKLLAATEHRGSLPSFPTIHAIEPARVARFWFPGEDAPLQPPEDVSKLFDPVAAAAISSSNADSTLETAKASSRSKVEKKDKVKLVKSWALHASEVEQATKENTEKSIEKRLAFVDQAAQIASAFQLSTSKASAVEAIAGGKLDDLADCLLQAVAWVKWQQNKTQLLRLWNEFSLPRGE